MCLPCLCRKTPDQLYQIGMEYWDRIPETKEELASTNVNASKLAIKSIKVLMKAADAGHQNAHLDLVRNAYACSIDPLNSDRTFKEKVDKGLCPVSSNREKPYSCQTVYNVYLSKAVKNNIPGVYDLKNEIKQKEKEYNEAHAEEFASDRKWQEERAREAKCKEEYIKEHAQEIMVEQLGQIERNQRYQQNALNAHNEKLEEVQWDLWKVQQRLY